MHTLVFLPGIMGTKLISKNGETIWPPTLSDGMSGFPTKKLEALLDPETKPGEIIEKAADCFDVYNRMLAHFSNLGFKKGSKDKELCVFPYDWRQDLEETSKHFEQFMMKTVNEGTTKISIVAHSMGGLVARLALENLNPSWGKMVDQVIFLATPHLGAPKALSRILGLEKDMGISEEQFRIITNDARYPSAYQLLPPEGEDIVWDQTQAGIDSINIYDERSSRMLGLNPILLKAATRVHRALKKTPPEHINYFHVVGTGHKTMTRLNLLSTNSNGTAKKLSVTMSADSGDGTVPFWSAGSGASRRHVIVNEHMKVFRGTPFKKAFYRLLGGDAGVALDAIGPSESDPFFDGMITITTPVVPNSKMFQITISFNSPISEVSGLVTMGKLNKEGELLGDPKEIKPVVVKGVNIEHLVIDMPKIDEAGAYELSFRCAEYAIESERMIVMSGN